MAIHLRSAEELEKMHRAGLFVHEILTALRSAVKPGISTMDLEKLAEEKIAGRPGKAAFKGYRGYPCVLCTSVNSEIVHGIPSPKRKLREGDIVSIDFGMEVDGYYADSAVTVPVGKIRPEVQKLLDVTRESLDRAIDKMRAGNRLGDVGHAVQSWVEQNGFSVVREFVGHVRELVDPVIESTRGELAVRLDVGLSDTTDPLWERDLDNSVPDRARHARAGRLGVGDQGTGPAIVRAC